MKKTRKTRGARKAALIGGDLMLAPMVMMMRMPLLVADAQSDRKLGRETVRAVTEKTAAAAQGAIAAQVSLLQSAARFWPEVLSGRVPSLVNGEAALQSLGAALKPAGRTVRANFRRLSSRS
ncbi:hypothetical protein [Mesorhizobium sp. B4-1-1]|uniref:hypothetical protein n=1 Tax=Mesorhizobium sp. B4-1-1 TaxID=2589890 RepID=UPI001128CC34|nr:hypothetical protein [Mesorhizobium sp. B4-1-1]TPI12366.1 hypothetical protein FJW10_27445 [Mesorhizobium sp. B4-1-1]